MKEVLKKSLFVQLFFALVYLSILPAALYAGDKQKTVRASFSSPARAQFKLDKTTRLRYAPVSLSGGTKLTLITPEQWMPLANRLSGSLEGLHKNFEDIFGTIPPFEVSLRLMDDEQFYKKTGAPRWTNAMFYRGQIIIPLSARDAVDMDNIYRSVKHEYSHAVVHAMSAGTCPGWLDEGLAQWVEGEENPSLLPAMVQWIKKERPPLAFSTLQGGFTGLEKEKVPVAYAQSLYSTRFIFEEFGFEPIRKYLTFLKEKRTRADAFRESFHVSEQEFEKKFEKHVKKLSETHRSKFDR